MNGYSVEIHREEENGLKGTMGRLIVLRDDEVVYECFTAEPDWLNNAKNKSCIPAGTYQLRARRAGRYYSKASGDWGHDFGFIIDGTKPARDLVLIHWGNYPADAKGIKASTRGCVLVGRTRDIFKDLNVVWQSKAAYKEFYNAVKAGYNDSKVNGDRIPLAIYSPQNDEAEDDLKDDRESI